MVDESTISYYNINAKEYSVEVNKGDMFNNILKFLNYINKNSSIIDIGCGSGRDLKFFKQKGYQAFGIDASKELCKIASDYSKCPVECVDFISWKSKQKFDAFWANASLIHLKKEEIINFFASKFIYLKKGGIIYFSMKKNIKDGYDNKGRYFTSFSEDLLESILNVLPKATIMERWTNCDNLGRNIKWESIINNIIIIKI